MSAKERILAEIRATGPIPFERFMELALYDRSGFFGGDHLRSEKGGDFLTSPEVSSLFGKTLAAFVEREMERIGEPFQLLEVGAGSGSLLTPLLETVDVDAWAIEISPAARSKLTGLLPGDRILSELPEQVRGVILANELLDNLPMAMAQLIGGGWRERWVGAEEGTLHFVDADPRPEILEWLEGYGGQVPEGGWVEVQLAAHTWLNDALSTLDAGSIVIIDYGDTAENLVPRRSDGTLRTYRAHHLGPHPLDEPGATDITADVNFSALIATAEAAGASVELHRQDDFLAELGLRDRLSQLRHAELEAAQSGDEMERLRLRSLKIEAETLLHPRGLGDFRVLVARV
ncbi:MAG: SAM-dependent methyltransferase [Actinobacteria bacterium]|nr:SAM-dependent methyltransferase [Actinomycetota bacterium]